jgi:hypothetical protein
MVTAPQIMLKFSEPNIHRVYRRLRKLEDLGYVKHERIAHKVGVYFGTNEAVKATGSQVTVPRKATIYTIQHHLLITDLILYHEFLAQKKGVDFRYKTEREIRFGMMGEGNHLSKLRAFNDNRDRIPDAVFFFKSLEGTVSTTWVELELNKKDQKRYKEKFQLFEKLLSGEKLEGMPYHYDQVIYFTDQKEIQHAIHAAKQPLLNGERISVKAIPSVILEERWEEVRPDGATAR